MCWLIRGGVSGHVKGQLTAANFPLQAARGARVSEPKFSPQHRAWHFEGGELGRGGGRRKSLADLDFRVIAKETRPGEKLFGFLRFFISRCASNLCGQNGSGRAGRLWYTRSPAKTLGEALVRAADRAPVRGTMPCIVFRLQIDAEVSKHGFDLLPRYRVLGRRRPGLIEVRRISRCALSQFENSLPGLMGRKYVCKVGICADSRDG
jgi:hypothetical protein